MEKAAEPNKDIGAILSGGCKLSNAWQKIAHLRATLRIGQNLVDEHFSNPSLSLDSLVNPCHLSDSVVWILLIMVQMLQQPEGHQRILYRLNNGSCFPWDRMDEGSRANYCFSCSNCQFNWNCPGKEIKTHIITMGDIEGTQMTFQEKPERSLTFLKTPGDGQGKAFWKGAPEILLWPHDYLFPCSTHLGIQGMG